MDPRTFQKICRIVYERSGITLNDSKEALLTARLGKRIRAVGCADYEAYLQFLLNDGTGDEMVELLDAISTNVTSFFREPEHFDFLTREIPRLHRECDGRLRFWSAACSTGEEPYSLAATVLEALGGRPTDLKILATDISTRVLEKGREGIYEKEKADAIPGPLREKYFECLRGSGEVRYRAKESLRSPITFHRLNLSVTPFALHGPFQAIFCRNVMIYFDEKVRKALLMEMHRLLAPGGILLVGHAESLSALGTPLHTIRPSIYIRSTEGCVLEGVRR
jgi:chemotaxis protein methyltransferase CheR